MTDKEIRDKTREEIAQRCIEDCDSIRQEKCDKYVAQYGQGTACKYCGADQILAIPSLAIVDRTAEHPKGDWEKTNSLDLGFRSAIIRLQGAGYVKEIPKEVD